MGEPPKHVTRPNPAGVLDTSRFEGITKWQPVSKQRLSNFGLEMALETIQQEWWAPRGLGLKAFLSKTFVWQLDGLCRLSLPDITIWMCGPACLWLHVFHTSSSFSFSLSMYRPYYSCCAWLAWSLIRLTKANTKEPTTGSLLQLSFKLDLGPGT